MKKPKLKRLVSGVVSTALALNTLSVLPALAAEDDVVSPYPYTIFAGSSEDGAITTTAYNFSVNGNVGTNGTIVSTGNMNINGQRKEHLSEDMPVIFDEINAEFFSGNVELHTDDYTYSDTNISVSVPLDVNGELDLNGNITITTGVKALDDIDLSGEVQNTSDSVICSQNGDITIDSTNVTLTGLIYAPYGTVDITAQNLNLNSVVIIADKVRIDAPNVNANNSAAIAEFVGRAMGNTNTGSDDESSSLTDSSSETDSSSQDDSSSDTETETHEEETPEVTPAIYAFGNVSKDNTEIEINWYSNIKGDYVIYESSDNENYESAAIVSDEESYTYSITDNFDKKYFKVSVNSLEQSAVSIPFVVKRTSSGYVAELLDTDEDRLADLYEQMLGTDINDTDTDDDTLTDYEEVYVTGTNPLVYDSVTEGVSDADADSDEDGLTNRQEITLGTNPQKADTDGDTISDGDEVNVYHTDPLVPDTDGDGLDDGDEVLFGEDPNNEDSNGNATPDGEEKRTQTFTHEVENKDCAVTEVTVTMDASGNINNTTEIESIMDKDYMCSRVVGLVGEPFSIETTSDFTEATLTFKVDKTKLGDTEFDNLMFLWYDEENDNFVELETEHDVDASTVSITTTHFSKYCIVDAKTWFENWKMIAEKIESPSPSIATAIIIKCQNRNDPYFDFDEYDENGNVTDTIRANYRSLIVDNLIDTMSDKDMIGFTYYQRSGGMLNGFESDKDEIDSIKENYYYNLSLGGFNQLTNINWGIDSAGSSLIYNAKDSIKRIVMITDSDISYNSIYVNILKSHSISVYFFCIGDFKTTNIQTLADGTGGEVFQIVNSNEPEEVIETVCYMEQVEREKASRKPDNTPHYSDEDEFYDEQETAGLIYNSCGERVYTDFLKGDTDDDRLLDSEEVSVFESFEDVQLENQYYYGRKYFHQMYSDPNNADTDGDGIPDSADDDPIHKKMNKPLNAECIASLKSELVYQIENDIAPRTKIKATNNNYEEHVNKLIEYDTVITYYANKYNLPKSFIQSILLRELYCYGYDDIGGDLAFINYCRYRRQCDIYYSQSQEFQFITPPPILPIPYKIDASTGIGQITTNTAINAHNYGYKKGYKQSELDNNWSNREMLFWYLQDDTCNIEMIGLVLIYGWDSNRNKIESYNENYWNLTSDQIKTLFTIYNTGDAFINDYGEKVYNLYEILEKYQ